MSSLRFTVNTKRHERFTSKYVIFQNTFIRNATLICMGVEIILFDNSVLNIDLLNTQTSTQNNLIISSFSLIKQLVGIICGKGHIY